MVLMSEFGETAVRTFVAYGLELSQIAPLIIFHLKKKYLCKTEAEIKEAWYPGDLGYATRVPGDMLIVTITLCYSVIAPLIIPFGVVYFGLGRLILQNQALKVYVPSYESYGTMWPHMHLRILAALLLYQLTMFAYFGVKKFYYASFLIPLIILTLIFAYVCNEKFYRFFRDLLLLRPGAGSHLAQAEGDAAHGVHLPDVRPSQLVLGEGRRRPVRGCSVSSFEGGVVRLM
ncbi:hypothetical protein NL676_012530 [Syzygium grande]|nr:hypothetical protein NL676_012530 [Syzygium grande]